jgi:exportin-1
MLHGLQAYESGSEDDEKFVQNLAIFLTTFLKEHLQLIESQPDLQHCLITALSYLINISYVLDAGESHAHAM